MEIKIGILLPRSDMYPTFAFDFLRGLKLVLNHDGNSIVPKYVVESIGNATGDSVLKTAEKMIFQENVDLTISFCSVFILKDLVGIFDSYKKSLIHVDLGGNVLKKEHSSPYVIHHSLHLWQSFYYSGDYAVNNFGKSAAITASFYDGGYHLTESFLRGFTEKGGEISYSYVSPMNYNNDSVTEMCKNLEQDNPDFVFALFSYNEGRKVLEIINELELNQNIPFLISPFMSNEIQKFQGLNLENVYSVMSWDFEDETTEMKDFKTSYLSLNNGLPNVISLLAFEVGLIIKELIGPNLILHEKVGINSMSLRLNTPRGEISFGGFNESQLAKYKIGKFVQQNDQYEFSLQSIIEVENQEKLNKKFKDLPYSGWQNPYIIT